MSWGLMLVLVCGLTLAAALQWFGLARAWRDRERWASSASWRDVPWTGRLLAAIAVVVGLVGAVLLAGATDRTP